MKAIKAYYDGHAFVPVFPVNVEKTELPLLRFWIMLWIAFRKRHICSTRENYPTTVIRK
jgi:hypothetical protein